MDNLCSKIGNRFTLESLHMKVHSFYFIYICKYSTCEMVPRHLCLFAKFITRVCKSHMILVCKSCAKGGVKHNHTHFPFAMLRYHFALLFIFFIFLAPKLSYQPLIMLWRPKTVMIPNFNSWIIIKYEIFMKRIHSVDHAKTFVGLIFNQEVKIL